MDIKHYLQAADELAGEEGVSTFTYSPDVPEPGPLHYALVDLVENLLTAMNGFVANSGDKVPPMLKVLARVLPTMRGVMLEEIGGVDPEQIRTFLQAVVIAPVQRVIDTPTATVAHASKPRRSQSA